MSFGFWQIVIIVLLGVLLFGRGRIGDLMGEVARGIKSFRKGLAEDEAESPALEDDQKKADNAFNITPEKETTKE